MEPDCSLPRLQVPATWAYPKPDQFSQTRTKKSQITHPNNLRIQNAVQTIRINWLMNHLHLKVVWLIYIHIFGPTSILQHFMNELTSTNLLTLHGQEIELITTPNKMLG